MNQRIVYLIFVLGVVGACENNSHMTSPKTAQDSGIAGTVLIGPMRPGIRGQPSPDVPFAATIVVQDHNRRDVATLQSGKDGSFRIPLPPGNYWLNPMSPKPGAPPSASPVQVTVQLHRFTFVEIRYDTGLR